MPEGASGSSSAANPKASTHEDSACVEAAKTIACETQRDGCCAKTVHWMNAFIIFNFYVREMRSFVPPPRAQAELERECGTYCLRVLINGTPGLSRDVVHRLRRT